MNLLTISSLLFSIASHAVTGDILSTPRVLQPVQNKDNPHCFCYPEGTLPKVLQLIDPNDEGVERLVVYIYKKTGTNEIKLYIPNPNKQVLIPDLPYDLGDKVLVADTEKIASVFLHYPNKIKVHNNVLEILPTPEIESLSIGLYSGPIEHVYPEDVTNVTPNNKEIDGKKITTTVPHKEVSETHYVSPKVPDGWKITEYGTNPEIPQNQLLGSQNTNNVLISTRNPEVISPSEPDLSDSLTKLQVTFNVWFDKQIKKFQGLNLPFDIRTIDNKVVKQLVQNTLTSHNIIISDDGIIRDSTGQVIDPANLELRPFLIGEKIGYQVLQNSPNSITFPKNLPYLEGILVTLLSPYRVLGVIPLGKTYLSLNSRLDNSVISIISTEGKSKDYVNVNPVITRHITSESTNSNPIFSYVNGIKVPVTNSNTNLPSTSTYYYQTNEKVKHGRYYQPVDQVPNSSSYAYQVVDNVPASYQYPTTDAVQTYYYPTIDQETHPNPYQNQPVDGVPTSSSYSYTVDSSPNSASYYYPDSNSYNNPYSYSNYNPTSSCRKSGNCNSQYYSYQNVDTVPNSDYSNYLPVDQVPNSASYSYWTSGNEPTSSYQTVSNVPDSHQHISVDNTPSSVSYQTVDNVPSSGSYSYSSVDNVPSSGSYSYQTVDSVPNSGSYSYKVYGNVPNSGSYSTVNSVPNTGSYSYSTYGNVPNSGSYSYQSANTVPGSYQTQTVENIPNSGSYSYQTNIGSAPNNLGNLGSVTGRRKLSDVKIEHHLDSPTPKNKKVVDGIESNKEVSVEDSKHKKLPLESVMKLINFIKGKGNHTSVPNSNGVDDIVNESENGNDGGGPDFRIIGGNAATGSGTPLSSKGRSGYEGY